MKRFAFVVVATGVAGCAVVWAQGQSGKKEAKFVSADKAVFEQVIPGVSRATLWGNPNTGPHGAFTKFVPRFDAGVHTHTNDLRVVVIRGAYLYKADGTETRAGAGRVPPHPRRHEALERW